MNISLLKLKRIFIQILLPACLLLLSATTQAAETYFRSVLSGNWEDVSTWESSEDAGITWNSATIAPAVNLESVIIRSPHNVTLSSAVAILLANPGLLVEEGATFTFDTDAAYTGTLNVYGDVIHQSQNTLGGTGDFHSNSNYYFRSTTATQFPENMNWLPGANAVINQYPTAGVSLMRTALANLIVDVQGITEDALITLAGNATTLDTLTINRFSGGKLFLGCHEGESSKTITLENYIQKEGTVILASRHGGTNRATHVNINKDFIAETGSIRTDGSSLSPGNHPTITFTNTSAVASKIDVGSAVTFGDGEQNNSRINIATAANANIDFLSSELKGSIGTFRPGNNAQMASKHPDGFYRTAVSGCIQFTGTRTYPTGSSGVTFIYNGTSLQYTGDVINNANLQNSRIVVDNPVGVVFNNTSVSSVNNSLGSYLIINQGYFDIGTRQYTGYPFQGDGELRTQNTTTTTTGAINLNAGPTADRKFTNGTVHYNGTADQVISTGSNGSTTYYNLRVSGGKKSIPNSSGSFLTITGEFFENIGGVEVDVSPNNSLKKVVYNRNGDQQVAGIAYYDLEITGSGTKTVMQPGTVSNNVTVTNATLNGNGNLTLLATPAKNANIGPLSGSAAVTGDVKVQSILTGGVIADRGVRTLSSPINNNLSEKKTLASLKEYIPLMGSAGHTGLDEVAGMKFNVSYISRYIETRDETVSPHEYINNVNENLRPGEGFQVFFIGNRDNIATKVKAPYANPETVTVEYEGVVNQGTISIPVTKSGHAGDGKEDGRNLLGNPYPATLDAQTFLNANTANLAERSLYTFRKNKAVASYNALTNSGANGGSRYVRPGQGFYIYANKNADIVFQETHKWTGNNYGNISVMSAKTNRPVLSGRTSSGKSVTPLALASPIRKIKLRLNNSEAEEETVIAFSTDFIDNYNSQDSKYFPSTVRTVLSSFTADHHEVVFNLLSDITERKEIILKTDAALKEQMTLSFSEIENMEGIDVYVKDNYLNTQTPIDLSDSTFVYVFNMYAGQPDSYGKGRLHLVFEPNATLPVINQSFTLQKDNQKVILNFSATANEQVEKYIVERSGDSKNFTEIGVLLPNGNRYVFNDSNPLAGNNYYRIKTVYPNKTDLSVIKNIKFTLEDTDLSVYPNPAKDKLHIASGITNGEIDYVITNTLGVKVLSGTLSHVNQVINIAGIPSGIYFIEIAVEKNKPAQTVKFIKE